jgi:hypothetical protein
MKRLRIRNDILDVSPIRLEFQSFRPRLIDPATSAGATWMRPTSSEPRLHATKIHVSPASAHSRVTVTAVFNPECHRMTITIANDAPLPKIPD